ncbi:MAG: methyl-accepting chemotaxis protein [Thermodesulfobacteriota bacterium]|nr:methyl-accepting chemotaxis protein [Thermodesulfobacteriota bacterium]
MKLGIAIGSLSLIIIGMFLATWLTTSAAKDAGLIINLAGRQRMLSQKLTKEVLALEMERLKNGSVSSEQINTAKNTMKIFGMTLDALHNGGKAPLSLDLNTTEYRQCTAATESAASQLGKVASLWKSFAFHTEALLTGNGETDSHLKWLQANNITLLKEMNSAVGMMQTQSEQLIKTLLTRQLIGIAIGIFFMIFAGLTVMKVLSQLQKVNAFASKLGDGDLSARAGFTSNDELGAIGRNLDTTSENLAKMFQKIMAGSNSLASNAQELTKLSEQMSQGSSAVSEKSDSVTSATTEMSGNMSEVAVTTDEMNQQVSQVSISSQEAAQNISTMAAAAEEMSATVADIAANTEQARTVTNEAMANVENASERVDELGGAAREIDQISDVIVEIAEQTKLLALNATIEAARAGEAGKGFAVVANEIKELAAQTNNAVIEIRQKVEAMQNSTDNTIQEITGIQSVMDQVNEIVVNIAGAVEEQSVTTQDVARNISEAVSSVQLMSDSAAVAANGVEDIVVTVTRSADSAKSIAFDIEDINQSSTAANDTAAQVNELARELNSLGGNLKEMVGRFKL